MSENNKNFIEENIENKKEIDELSYDESTFSDVSTKIEAKKSKNLAKEIYEWVSSVAAAVVLALIINTFFISLVQVDGESMLPTLNHGERLIVRKIAYNPNNEDIVIVKSDVLEKYIVKRVIALPGQTMEFDEELNVVVDNEEILEPYINEKQVTFGMLYNFPLNVPKKGEVADLALIEAERRLRPDEVNISIREDGNIEVSGSNFVEDGVFTSGKTLYKQDFYFVMGDNRNNSSDSRSLGLIPKSQIIGEALVRIMPLSRFGLIK